MISKVHNRINNAIYLTLKMQFKILHNIYIYIFAEVIELLDVTVRERLKRKLCSITRVEPNFSDTNRQVNRQILL